MTQRDKLTEIPIKLANFLSAMDSMWEHNYNNRSDQSSAELQMYTLVSRTHRPFWALHVKHNGKDVCRIHWLPAKMLTDPPPAKNAKKHIDTCRIEDRNPDALYVLMYDCYYGKDAPPIFWRALPIEIEGEVMADILWLEFLKILARYPRHEEFLPEDDCPDCRRNAVSSKMQ
jgi:hypothetical protein